MNQQACLSCGGFCRPGPCRYKSARLKRVNTEADRLESVLLKELKGLSTDELSNVTNRLQAIGNKVAAEQLTREWEHVGGVA